MPFSSPATVSSVIPIVGKNSGSDQSAWSMPSRPCRSMPITYPRVLLGSLSSSDRTFSFGSNLLSTSEPYPPLTATRQPRFIISHAERRPRSSSTRATTVPWLPSGRPAWHLM